MLEKWNPSVKMITVFLCVFILTVQTAFRVRNMSGFSLRPKILFTMLVNSVRWSESVAMAMESKGFSGEAERTYHDIPKLRALDLALAVVSVGVVAFIA